MINARTFNLAIPPSLRLNPLNSPKLSSWGIYDNACRHIEYSWQGGVSTPVKALRFCVLSFSTCVSVYWSWVTYLRMRIDLDEVVTTNLCSRLIFCVSSFIVYITEKHNISEWWRSVHLFHTTCFSKYLLKDSTLWWNQQKISCLCLKKDKVDSSLLEMRKHLSTTNNDPTRNNTKLTPLAVAVTEKTRS